MKNVKRRTLRLSFFFIFHFTFFISSAQPPTIFFDHLTTKDGLSNNFVNAILKDRKGFVWIGTGDGLNRYDGKNFISFYHSIYDKNSITHNDVYSLLEDDLGYIWIGTFNGLCRLNPYTNEIRRFNLPDQSLSSAVTISDVKQNPYNGIIWVATNKGLFWVNQKKYELVQGADNENEKTLSATFITKILVTASDTFWLSTYNGIAKYCPSTGKYLSYIVPSQTSNPATLVKCIYMDKANKIWLGTWGRGLQRFDPVTETFTRFLPRADLGERSDANIIYSITQTGYAGEDSILWIAAEAVGLLAFNMQSGKFQQYNSGEENNKHGLFGYGFSFCLAKPEGLWIGGSNGVYRYDPHHQLFRNLSLNIEPGKHCLKEILGMYADPADKSGKSLLASTWSCGSYRISLKDGSVQELPSWIMQRVGSGYISAFHRDAEGYLWLATSGEGLLKADEKKRSIKSFTIPVMTGKKQYIEVLSPLGNNKLWIGTMNGLFLLDKQKATITPVFTKEMYASENISDEIKSITQDRDKNLWFCTNLRQNDKPVIGKIPANSLKPVLYYNIPAQPESFPETSPLQGITCDTSNNIWCASWNGLVYWNAAQSLPVFKRLTRKDGLCNDKVFKVEADRQGFIWIATLRGISCYDPGARSFRNYYTTEGLYQDNISNFFTNGITGEIIAGYDGVIDIVDPVNANRRSTPPSIEITGMKVFNETYANDKKSYLNKGLATLKPEQNMLTFSFSALAFTSPHNVRYAYKLEGVDKDWIFTQNDFVTYHNLPPGSRKFIVRSRNAEGIWSEDAWVEIDLAPPFYRTWWFILLVAATIAIIIYSVYRERIRRLEEKFKMRSIIARDLHDEIGSTLTSINILSRVSRSNLEKDQAKAAGFLQKITEQSQDMQQSMSDIIWAIKPDNDKLENMAARMREYLSQTLEAKDIALQFEADEQVMKESLSMEQRRDFFLIFKEAVNNAAKYAGSKTVSVSLKKEKNNIVLSVCDEGNGFDVTKKHTTNGLKNMQSRAASLKAVLVITSAPGKGTQVRLSIPTT
ncbi:MAG: two-component regulator propeller domain-containing protein [Chitinophagaceae bacterium]